MKFLHFTWRVIRALLITIAAVISMVALSPFWPIILLLWIAAPRGMRMISDAFFQIKVF